MCFWAFWFARYSSSLSPSSRCFSSRPNSCRCSPGCYQTAPPWVALSPESRAMCGTSLICLTSPTVFLCCCLLGPSGSSFVASLSLDNLWISVANRRAIVPINVYTGIMRSGKSYEVVSEVIVPAIRSGRRVVTNVEGISQERIHEYLKATYAHDDESLYGAIVHVSNTEVFDPEFFPYYDDHKGAHTDTLVQPCDLVCIDEAWRFWGSTDCKIHKNHKSFFLEHGHFTNEKTNVACDLVLLIQDMATLHRFLKLV